MQSAMRNHDLDLTLELQQESRTSTSILEQKLEACTLGDIKEKEEVAKGNDQDKDKEDKDMFRVRHRFNSGSKTRSPPAAKSSRPGLQKKSYSDLASYRDVHMKILVEGKEVLDTCLQEKYCFNEVTRPPQETENADHEMTESQQDSTKKTGKFFTGWLAKKTKSQSTEKSREPPIGFRTLKRSRSFSGRIKDKIRSISPVNSSGYNVGSQHKSNHLRPPLFYKIIDLNYDDNAIRGNSFQRRHSDQTDSMSRYPLGSNKYDIKPPRYYSMSLDRGVRTHAANTAKKPLVRKKSNSLEKLTEFPFWSQITDADRSRSCNARIRVADTHLDTSGTLETNLCSTEL